MMGLAARIKQVWEGEYFEGANTDKEPTISPSHPALALGGAVQNGTKDPKVMTYSHTPPLGCSALWDSIPVNPDRNVGRGSAGRKSRKYSFTVGLMVM